MAFNPYAGKTIAELLVLKEEALADYAAGSSVTQAGGAEVSMGMMIHHTPQHRLEKIFDALYALDPVTYPLNRRVARTRLVCGVEDIP